MLIFHEVEELVGEVKTRIGVLGSHQNTALEQKRLVILMQLVTYINGGMEWLSHESLRAKVRVFLRTRYSYDAVVQEHGMTKRQAIKCISYASDRLRKRIGSTLALIRNGNIEAAEQELAVLTGAIDSKLLFIGDITDKFPPQKDTGVALGSDCRRELSFLSALSRKRFESIVATLDDRRLKHILYVLMSSDKTFLRERSALWDCLVEGNSTVAECIQSLNDEYIYSSLSDNGGSESQL